MPKEKALTGTVSATEAHITVTIRYDLTGQNPVAQQPATFRCRIEHTGGAEDDNVKMQPNNRAAIEAALAAALDQHLSDRSYSDPA